MTIDEAIGELIPLEEGHFIRYTPLLIKAIKLGSEALKRVKSLRSLWGKDFNLKLPGETEE
jgi:hypothetical protein